MNSLALIWMITVQLSVTVVTVYLLVKILRSKKTEEKSEDL